MKSLRIFSLAALLMAFATVSFGQTKTEKFQVSGNCGMCKSNIEKAAKVAGAKEASWNKDTKELTVKYNSSTTNTAKIQQQIANAGYDNAGFKTTLEAYNKLHACCQYDRTAVSGKASCADKCADGDKMDCCKDGKCTKPGHKGGDCCKKS